MPAYRLFKKQLRSGQKFVFLRTMLYFCTACEQKTNNTKKTEVRRLCLFFILIKSECYYSNKSLLRPTTNLLHPCVVMPAYQLFFGIRRSAPPIYILSASGIETVPSALRLFSRNAISILGGATTVLLRV